jgi:polyisoprenoid-binding protein YceI
MKWILPALLALAVVPSVSWAEAPVFTIVPSSSSVTFDVKKASLPIKGRFDKWTSTLTFTSPDLSTGVFEITVDAASVDTGSGLKNGKLKSGEFFDVKNNPVISFRSTKISQTGPGTVALAGDFTIRGVTKPQTVTLNVTRDASGGVIKGTMTFDRKDYGMNGGIPFVKIGDHVDVTIDMTAKRISGPPVALQP